MTLPALRPQLVYNQTLPTQTSMQTNSAVISIPDTRKTIRIVDVPGHPRVRHQFKESLDDAKAIAFVVDASTVSRSGAAVAEYVISSISWPETDHMINLYF